MSPQEFWLIVEVRKPPKMIGAMRADVFDELKALRDSAVIVKREENPDA